MQTDQLNFDVKFSHLISRVHTAQRSGKQRLLALAQRGRMTYHTLENEVELQEWLAFRYNKAASESFRTSIAIVCINLQDSDNTIKKAIEEKLLRSENGSGYFEEALQELD